mmetsp:Transcript_88081/g.196936  ORF Transcript_88081/g.196936 Transcript_88081/m.196936 type:complete len:207 (-) Transcript_88081:746-1366(-)
MREGAAAGKLQVPQGPSGDCWSQALCAEPSASRDEAQAEGVDHERGGAGGQQPQRRRLREDLAAAEGQDELLGGSAGAEGAGQGQGGRRPQGAGEAQGAGGGRQADCGAQGGRCRAEGRRPAAQGARQAAAGGTSGEGDPRCGEGADAASRGRSGAGAVAQRERAAGAAKVFLGLHRWGQRRAGGQRRHAAGKAQGWRGTGRRPAA